MQTARVGKVIEFAVLFVALSRVNPLSLMSELRAAPCANVGLRLMYIAMSAWFPSLMAIANTANS